MLRVIFSFLFLVLSLNAQHLNVWMYAGYQPFSMLKGDDVIGYEIDLLEELSKRLNFTYTVTDFNLNDIVEVANGENVDMVISTVNITNERRKYQDDYNKANNITPHSASRNIEDSLRTEDSAEILRAAKKMEKMPAAERAKIIKELRREMLDAASKLEFEKAAALRDEIAKIKEI